MARVTVIIPANTCPCAQVAVVYRQLGPNDQLIVVFNGMKDSSPCAGLLRRYDKVTALVVDRALGPGGARNAAVKEISDSPVALLFCDADDEVGKDWLETLATPLLDGSTDLAAGALAYRVDCPPLLPGHDFKFRLAAFGSNFGILLGAFRALGGFDESLDCCEDTDLAWRASGQGLRVVAVAGAIVRYRLRPPLGECFQRLRWGRYSVALLAKHNVPLSDLPTFAVLLADKRATRFATIPVTASLAQWAGQCLGRSHRWIASISPRSASKPT